MTQNSSPPVTVIGLGPMGQAMAAAYLESGFPTTVFNRTASRSDALVDLGATRAETAAEALAAAELIIISLTHYQAMYELLEPAVDQLQGRTLVNLSSDTPREAERAAAWANAHGATFLDAGIMVNAPLVGKEGSYLYVSGDLDAYPRHRSTLEVLGETDYRGDRPGLALLWYQANLDLFMTTLASIQHASALLGSAGVSAAEFLPHVDRLMTSMPYFTDGMAAEIDQRSYPDAGANVAMMAAGMDHITEASRDAGIDTGLPEAVQRLYHRALAAGHGQDSSTSLYEMIIKAETEGVAA